MSGEVRRRAVVGRPATQPPRGWSPPARRDGLVVQFVSEDGSQRKVYDFALLPGRAELAEDFAAAFEAATGPLGSWRRVKGADNLWQAARQAGRWLAETRPELTGLGQLSAADAVMMAHSFRVPSGEGLTATLRALLRYSPAVSAEANQALARMPRNRGANARQPYTAEEFARISVVARGIARRARHRLQRHPDPDIDHGAGALPLRHLSTQEVWAFGVLLAGLTGMNLSTLSELPAPHLVATAPGEAGIALVDASKPRRGARSAMTMPIAALPQPLRPVAAAPERAHVLNTSLTTAFGVFSLLIALTEPARASLGVRHAFVYCASPLTADPVLRTGLPRNLGTPASRAVWVREYLTGEDEHDALLTGISMDRLRKTYLSNNRKPVAHTPATLARYLGRMRSVTTEGFQIVREALDEQVADALARRRITLAEEPADGSAGQDTVLGECSDFEHSPLDEGRSCRQSFLSCLECGNARAFPRHLPVQLLVLDQLKALRRPQVGLGRWVEEFAGRAAQLEDLLGEYEPAQLDHARAQIDDGHRAIVARLFSGDLDPL